MKIYLVRHGEKTSDAKDGKLTEKGIYQIDQISKYLNNRIAKVYSSSFVRSIESAKIISKNCNCELVIRNEIEELPKSLFFTDIKTNHMSLIEKFLYEVEAEGKDVAFAMHNGTNRAVMSRLLGISLKETLIYDIYLGSLTILDKREYLGTYSWRINLLNFNLEIL